MKFNGNLASCNIMWNTFFLLVISWKVRHFCGDFHLKCLKCHATFINYAVSGASVSCPCFFPISESYGGSTPSGVQVEGLCAVRNLVKWVVWGFWEFLIPNLYHKEIFSTVERNMDLKVAVWIWAWVSSTGKWSIWTYDFSEVVFRV